MRAKMDMLDFKLCFRENIQTILSYPLFSSKQKITITVEDFKCLDRGQYLNDVIIDFYLKYLTLEKLSLKDQKRVYVFNTYFYTCLSQSTLMSKNRDKKMLAATRHTAVKNWTKQVNIFEKDFIIIPIHKSAHWFLTVICYPSLIDKSKNLNKSSISDNSRIRARSRIECPCLLMFDSRSSGSRSIPHTQVAHELIEYLKSEYIAKTGDHTLQCNDLKIIYPDVPQQKNSFDCGLYVLQFVENLFEDFVITKKLKFQIKYLKNWFNRDRISEKRVELKRLLVHLATMSLERSEIR